MKNIIALNKRQPLSVIMLASILSGSLPAMSAVKCIDVFESKGKTFLDDVLNANDQIIANGYMIVKSDNRIFSIKAESGGKSVEVDSLEISGHGRLKELTSLSSNEFVMEVVVDAVYGVKGRENNHAWLYIVKVDADGKISSKERIELAEGNRVVGLNISDANNFTFGIGYADVNRPTDTVFYTRPSANHNFKKSAMLKNSHLQATFNSNGSDSIVGISQASHWSQANSVVSVNTKTGAQKISYRPPTDKHLVVKVGEDLMAVGVPTSKSWVFVSDINVLKLLANGKVKEVVTLKDESRAHVPSYRSLVPLTGKSMLVVDNTSYLPGSGNGLSLQQIVSMGMTYSVRQRLHIIDAEKDTARVQTLEIRQDQPAVDGHFLKTGYQFKNLNAKEFVGYTNGELVIYRKTGSQFAKAETITFNVAKEPVFLVAESYEILPVSDSRFVIVDGYARTRTPDPNDISQIHVFEKNKDGVYKRVGSQVLTGKSVGIPVVVDGNTLLFKLKKQDAGGEWLFLKEIRLDEVPKK